MGVEARSPPGAPTSHGQPNEQQGLATPQIRRSGLGLKDRPEAACETPPRRFPNLLLTGILPSRHLFRSDTGCQPDGGWPSREAQASVEEATVAV